MIIEMYKNSNYNNSSMLLYLFLSRVATEDSGEAVIENFSRNSIIEDMKSIMPWIHKGTMYNAFDQLFDMNLITYGLQADGSADESMLYILGSTDGFVPGEKGYLYILDLFFKDHFNKLRLGSKRVLMYILHRIGTSKSNIKISLNDLMSELLGLADLTTKYKILRAIYELKLKGIISMSELNNSVFFFQLTNLTKSVPQDDYVVDYAARHKKKAFLIQELIEKHGLIISPKELLYILRAVFRCNLIKVHEIISQYISYIQSQQSKKITNLYRFIQSMC